MLSPGIKYNLNKVAGYYTFNCIESTRHADAKQMRPGDVGHVCEHPELLTLAREKRVHHRPKHSTGENRAVHTFSHHIVRIHNDPWR